MSIQCYADDEKYDVLVLPASPPLHALGVTKVSTTCVFACDRQAGSALAHLLAVLVASEQTETRSWYPQTGSVGCT